MLIYHNSQDAINDGWHFVNTYDNQFICITGYTGHNEKVLEFPYKIGGKIVAAINGPFHNINIEKAMIGFIEDADADVFVELTLEKGLFKNNTKIQTIMFGPRVKAVPIDFARNCIRLTNVEWGCVESVFEGAFASTPMKVIQGNNNIEHIGPGAFSYSDVVWAILPHIATISNGGFYGCLGLKDLVLGENLAHIDLCVFANTGLEEIYLPKSLKSIPGLALSECEHLKRVYISEEMENIAANAFTASPNVQITYY